jgi:signal transduction histidine kinase
MRGQIRSVDAGACAAALAASQVEISMTADQVTGSVGAVRLLAAVVCGALVLVQASPVGAVLVATVGMTGLALVGAAPIAIPFLVFLFLLGNLGWRATRGDGLLGVAAAAAGLVGAEVGAGDLTPGDLAVNLVVGGAAWLGPHLVRGATDRRVAVEVAAERMAAAAVERERVRIARDLHDTVAHAVSVMTLQAGAARQNLDDRASTESALLAIEGSGRAAMEDLHGFLGLLKADREPESPGLGDLDRLLDGLRATGCQVRAVIPGSTALPLTAQTTAFRVVQESVTNAMKHQRLRQVDVRVDGDPLTVQVTSVGEFRTGPGTGSGLEGLRARVEAFGGTLVAAAGEASDTWVVRAALPVGGLVR